MSSVEPAAALWQRGQLSQRSRDLLLAAGALALGAAVLVFKASGGGHSTLEILLDGLAGTLFVVAGLVARRRGMPATLGLLMIAVGYAWFAEDLVTADDAVVFTIGAFTTSASAPLLVHLVLAYPSGHLRSRADRVVVALAYIAGFVLVPLAHLGHPTGPPCNCPKNLAAFISSQQAITELDDATAFAGVALAGAVVAILVHRWLRASRWERRMLAPVLVIGATIAAIAAVDALLRVAAGWHSRPVVNGLSLLALCALPLAFLFGLLRRELGHTALADLVVRLDRVTTVPELEHEVRRSLDDPTLVLALGVEDTDRYVAADGSDCELDDPARAATPVRRAGVMVGALLHDRERAHQPALMDAIASAVSLTLEREPFQAPAAPAAPPVPWEERRGAAVVGRGSELAQIDEYLAALADASAALLLEGEAGIGKTTLWREAVSRAETLGYRVLAASPAESETPLAFAALADLLAAVGTDELECLPQPQRRALDVALLRVEPDGPAPDLLAVSAGAVSLLRSLADERPVLVAVDDLQWLDRASGRVLTFAARRLPERGVGLLVCLRSGATPVPAELRSARRLEVGPLSLGALHQLVKETLGVSLPRPALVRIERLSGGNPLFALELARAPDAVPADLRELVRDRVTSLPDGTRDALLVAATADDPTLELVPAEALARAEEAGIVHVDGAGRITFAHPLYASAVYASASLERRRRAHGLLAQRVRGAEERARHLALAAAEPDAGLAAVLDDAAAQARARGALDAAAELKEEARRLTPPDDAEARVRRELEAAEAHLETGDLGRSIAIVERTVATVPPGRLRGEALLLLATARHYDDGPQAAVEAGERALADAAEAGDRRLESRIHSRLAIFNELDCESAARHARAALDLADERSDPAVYAMALLSAAHADLLAGLGADHAAVERGEALQAEGSLWETSSVPAAWARYMDDVPRARTLHRRYVGECVAGGDHAALARNLAQLAEVELAAGDWAAADGYAHEAVSVAEQAGQEAMVRVALCALGLVAAHHGRADEARACSTAALDEAVTHGDVWAEALARSALGFLELSLRRPAEADATLAAADELLERIGMAEPARFRFHPDHVEAVVALGDLDRAGELVARLEARSAALPRPWIDAVSARCRGLLDAARGDVEASRAALDRALSAHERLDQPFELGRTLLVLGGLERRARRKAAARDALDRALELFEGLGAGLWVERARAERDRLGLRRAPEGLTETERRVAELAAAGRSNREIAAELFMSRRTVETNLARAYRKLDISSRAELGARMAEQGPQAPS
jgi:DNA-binding CsgD family transcriptional regulator